MRRASISLVVVLVAIAWPGAANAQEAACKRFVIFTLPGVTWEMVDEFRPPNLLRIAGEGAAGSMSVRTNSSRTSHASGFVTIGAGTRTDGGDTAGAVATGIETSGPPEDVFLHDATVGGWPEILAAIGDADYESEPGALGSAMNTPLGAIGNGDTGLPPPTPAEYDRWPLLAAARTDGLVLQAAVGEGLLVPDADAPFGVRTDGPTIETATSAMLEDECFSAVIDQGDLIRADTYGLFFEDPGNSIMKDALLAADELLGHVDGLLDEDDLLIVVSPTSPWWDEEVHLGVAVAKGPGYPAGYTLESASTRQTHFVTLPDVAPTALAFLGLERPDSMLGRPFVAVGDGGDLVDEMVTLDRESVFAHGSQAGISTAFVLLQIVVYVIAFLILTRRERKEPRDRTEIFVRWLRRVGLGIVAFPFSTYLATPIAAHELGTPLFIGTLIAIDIAIVTVVSLLLKDPLERLLAITGSTVALFIIDLGLLQQLQLNAVWGNDPIVAGRFTGLGNIAFAILGSSSLMTGALLFHRYPNARWVYAAVAGLFVATVVVDGAPQLGSDVGGILALVPALGITYVLLLGKRPNWKIVLIGVLGALVALGLFLAVDLSRPEESRTHLARLFEDIQNRGLDAFWEAAGRKVRTNLRVFRSTIWTYLVPPALGVIAWLLLRPSGRWRELAATYPKLRAGLIGGLVLAVIGFAVNDSGIVVPAMVLSFLAPMSLLIHLMVERDRMEGSSS